MSFTLAVSYSAAYVSIVRWIFVHASGKSASAEKTKAVHHMYRNAGCKESWQELGHESRARLLPDTLSLSACIKGFKRYW